MAIRKNPLEFTYINSDGHGYYGHLPAIFIYQDLHFGFIEELQNSGLKHTAFVDDFRRSVDGGIVNITYIGVSIVWIPFFLVAHLFALISPYQANGYTTPYQLSVLIAAISYLMLGLWAFGLLLQRLKIKAWVISFCLIIMVCATSTIYYVLDQPSFTHIYTMALFCLFLLSFYDFFRTYNVKYLWIGMLVIGVLGIIRPVNVAMILALPVMAGSWDRFWTFILWIFKNPLKFLAPLLLCLGILFIQPLVYYIQTSHFFVWSYQGASFDFSNPQIWNILFSYEKGLFVYTPILLFTIIGFVKLWFVSKFKFFWLLISILVPIYILASWWNWWFGMSFGHRAFIDYYPLFFLAIAYGMHHIQKSFYINVIVIAAVMLVSFNFIQLMQYRNYIYHWSMDKDMYWRVFLRTSLPYHGLLWEEEKLNNTLSGIQSNYPVNVFSILQSFENPKEHIDVKLKPGIAHTGLYSVKMEAEELYGDILRMKVPGEILNGRFALASHIFIKTDKSPIDYPVYFLVETFRDQESVHRMEFSSRYPGMFSGQWCKMMILHQGGIEFHEEDTFVIYMYNPHHNSFYIDDFSLYIYGKHE
jgi:hypothetical protein